MVRTRRAHQSIPRRHSHRQLRRLTSRAHLHLEPPCRWPTSPWDRLRPDCRPCRTMEGSVTAREKTTSKGSLPTPHQHTRSGSRVWPHTHTLPCPQDPRQQATPTLGPGAPTLVAYRTVVSPLETLRWKCLLVRVVLVREGSQIRRSRDTNSAHLVSSSLAPHTSHHLHVVAIARTPALCASSE